MQFSFGTEQEFYLFRSDDFGEPTMIPYDHAGYMDIAPEDKGENIRREICLTLEQMGIHPESSHHEQGPGQNEIDFRYSDPMTAADNALTFQTVVKAVALRNGLCADFSPKPLRDQPGNGFHINISVKSDREFNYMDAVIAGILDKISVSQMLSLALVSVTAYVTATLVRSEPIYESLLANLLQREKEEEQPVYAGGQKVLSEFVIMGGSALENRTVMEIDLPDNCLLVAVDRGGKEFIPKGKTCLMAGDKLTVMADERDAGYVHDKMKNLCYTSF